MKQPKITVAKDMFWEENSKVYNAKKYFVEVTDGYDGVTLAESDDREAAIQIAIINLHKLIKELKRRIK